MNAALIAALTWASALSGLPWNGDLPKVRQVSACTMLREWHRKPMTQADCEKELALDNHVYAMFTRDTNTVTLPDTFDLASTFDLQILVHEMTHYLQFQNRLPRVDCAMGYSKAEYQAYTAGMKYVQASGEDSALYGLTPELIAGYARPACAAS